MPKKKSFLCTKITEKGVSRTAWNTAYRLWDMFHDLRNDGAGNYRNNDLDYMEKQNEKDTSNWKYIGEIFHWEIV